jgi:type IV pilus assembly protein PilE
VKSRAQRGFTLIEALIVLGIIGILSAIAYPSYQQYVIRANRSAAQGYMLNLANKQEQYLLDKRAYFCTAPNTCTNVEVLTSVSTMPVEVSRNYTVTVAAPNSAVPPTFTITATPISTSQQANDSKCRSQTYTNVGVNKGVTGSPTPTGTATTCW